MTKVVSLVDKVVSKEEALAVINALKETVERGEVVAFVAVGVTDTDECLMFASSVKPVTMLRMLGAIDRLHFNYQSEVIRA